MQKRSFLLIVVLVGTLLFCLSCEDKGVEKITAGELIQKGWLKFEAGNFAGARSEFTAALSISTSAGDSSETLLGLGWAELRQSQAGLAEKSFVEYLGFNSGSDDGSAGVALAYLAQAKFQSAIDAANAVLSSNSSWSFGHDPSIDHLDLRLLLAQSYYELADFDKSLEIVRYFEPGFPADPDTPEGRRSLGDMIEGLWERVA